SATRQVHVTDHELQYAHLGLLAALHDGDAGMAYGIVLGLMGNGYPFTTIVEQAIAPIQVESGRRWQEGDYSISDEHVSTAAAETLLATLAGAFDQPADADHVVVGCAEGDGHTMPARMAASVLLAEGWRTTFLGSSVPAADLTDYLERARPAALVLSCAMAANLRGARASVVAAHRAGVPVVTGGRGFGRDDTRSRAIGADAWSPTLSGLVELLQTWHPDPTAAEGAVVDSSHSLAEVDRCRTAVLAAVAEKLLNHLPVDAPARAQNQADLDAEALHNALSAAVLVNDPALLRSHANWLAGVSGAHTLATLTADDLLDVMAEALEPVDDSVRRLVAAARAAT
ncbi:MAG: cobalamin-dependent protein, partial [Aquihabitans sp.]